MPTVAPASGNATCSDTEKDDVLVSINDSLLEPDGPAVPTPTAPPSWKPGEAQWDESKNKGFVSTPASPDAEQPGNWDDILRMWNFDPDLYEIVGPINRRQWGVNKGEGELVNLHYFRANIQRKGANELGDLTQLMKVAAKSAKKTVKTARTGSKPKTTVVAFADAQTGKVDRLGGTAALLERVAVTSEKLERYFKEVKSDSAAFFDLGDIVESFENTPQQAFTNDLSLMDQIDLASTIEHSLIKLTYDNHNSTKVAGVGSNHCQWRSGKGILGKPKDDWGLFIQRQIKKSFDFAGYSDLEFHEPQEWEESIALDLNGTWVGAAHGHQVNNPNNIPTWWAQQAHGAGSVAHAEILLTGHFHHYLARQTGTSLHSGRPKMHFQAPTLDNGSSWFTNSKGERSQPGLLVFTVGEDGINWEDHRIINAK